MRNPKYIPELDKDFKPCIIELDNFLNEVKASNNYEEIKISVERNIDSISTISLNVSKTEHAKNCYYVERLVKTLLWIKGGYKVIIGGPKYLGQFISDVYSPGNLRDFDRKTMETIYEHKFVVEITDLVDVPDTRENSKPIGRHLEGCRIGFDAGGSDRKVSAVINGRSVYSEEIIWNPKTSTDPKYHYNGILESMKTAASKMPRVDAIGVSAAGIYRNNRVMLASLFMAIPKERFDKEVKNIFLDIQKNMGEIPFEVANDGDVTALAGAMELKDTNVLGIAMGTSEAGGYVDSNGNITGWLNELAFVPVDLNMDSMVDEWSGDYGCGVKYLSQDGVIKLAQTAGIRFDKSSTPAQKLKYIQDLQKQKDPLAAKIFESIGIYLGYSIAWYSRFYDIKHILVLGRVVSEKGGELIVGFAKKVLFDEFPEIYSKILIHIPDEKNKRVGQSIAAASLPKTDRST